MQIGTLAVRTGASQKALRYYEQLGVLAPARGENGYREYREADVRVVEVVRSLGRLGIPVEQTRPFLDCLGAGHEHPDDCVASMAAYRMAIAQLSERIDALASMREELVARLEHAAARTEDGRPDERQDIVSDFMSLPSDLPAPEDDGAADHLAGLEVPAITLSGTGGGQVALDDLGPGRTVLYIYPLSGKPGIDLPDGWDAIPGARGCTPEACGFRTTTPSSAPPGPPRCSGCPRRAPSIRPSSLSACSCRSRSSPIPTSNWPMRCAFRPSPPTLVGSTRA